MPKANLDNVIKDLEWQLQEMVEDNDYYQEENEKLEKENEVLKKRNAVLKTRNADLKKRNAELKEQNKWYSEQVCNKECAEIWGKLTKAKEIIKSLLETPRTVYKRDSEGEVVPFENMAYARLKEEAEQFIKE